MSSLNFDVINKYSSLTNDFGEKVRLVGAVKMVDTDTIRAACENGLTEIGENKVQELTEKLPFYPPCVKHFIGHLQTNKVKFLIGAVDMIQSVDSLPLAERIARLSLEKGVTTDILLEVNIGRETQKYGFMPETAPLAALEADKLEGVRLKGVMTVLPKDTEENIIPLCLQMRELYDIIKRNCKDISCLSMGMSADFATAVKCGSNMIRLGSLIFGERHYNDVSGEVK